MPASYLKIGGSPIQSAILELVEVTQELNQHWWCRVECRQTKDARFPLEDTLGKDLQIVTYDQQGAEHIIFDGFVLDGELEYEVYGSYTARLTSVTRSYKLDLTAQEAYFRKKTLPDIARLLAAEDGLTVDVKCQGKPGKNYVQWGVSDFDFLKRLADDYHAWIRPTPQGIEICDSFQSGGKLQWRREGGGLLEFEIKGGLGQPSINGTHYNARTMQSTTLQKVSKEAEFFGSSAPLVAAVKKASADKLPPGYVHFDARAATAEEYKQLLERESVRAIGGKFYAGGISRSEALRPGDTVDIEGTLDAKGTYGITKVIHRWQRDGYQNQFWCTPWKNYLQPDPPAPRKIDGVVPARVTAHNDPRKMGRVQVQYDWQEDSSTAWVRMIAPHAGGDRGFMFMPEIGDEVLLAFEHGDPERPYVIGCLWNGVDQAPREEFWGGDIADNDVKRIVTKSGHRIQFSDKPGKESIVIATPSRLKIAMLEKADETGRSMIVLHSEDGDIFVNAPNGRVHFRSKYFSREVGVAGQPAASASGPSPASSALKSGAGGGGGGATAAAGGSGAGAGAATLAATQQKKKTWVEIELVDEKGKPVPREPYRIELPDGSVRTGTLDSKGRARVDGIDPGTCKVTFSKRDAKDWHKK